MKNSGSSNSGTWVTAFALPVNAIEDYGTLPTADMRPAVTGTGRWTIPYQWQVESIG